MINFRIIARFFSQVLIIQGIFMLISAGVSWIYNEQAAYSFLYSSIVTSLTGILVFTHLRNEEKAYSAREGYILFTGIWVIFSLFGTLPYIFSSSVNSFTDAFFESVSGFTTTGATVFSDVESLPMGILFWRSLTQWLGGIAIISLSLYILPIVKSLNVLISITEFSFQPAGKIHPKIVEVTKRLGLVYISFTFLQAILLIAGGMNLFDAVCQSFSTMSTGGFSTKNEGIASFSSSYSMIVITIFMLIAAVNPSVFYFFFKRDFKKITINEELRIYLTTIICFSLLIAIVMAFTSNTRIPQAIQAGLFNAVSIISTTGYYTADWNKWGHLLLIIIFILMFIGGMSGSPSGGLKISRLIIVARHLRNEFKRLVHPDAYLPIKIDNIRVHPNIVYNILIFLILYFIIACTGALLLSFFGYDIITSFGTSVSMLGNIGTGIGSSGPLSCYSGVKPTVLWILSLQMLLGRLELVTVIILFTGDFYRR